MDKIQKFLKRLSLEERGALEQILLMITASETNTLNLKKLQGYKDIYRVRYGDIRVIFQKTEQDIFVLEVSRRSEKTYKKF